MKVSNSGFFEYLKRENIKIYRLAGVITVLFILLGFFSFQEYRESFIFDDGNIVAVKENSGVVSLILKKYGNDIVDEKLVFDTSEIKEDNVKGNSNTESQKSSLMSLFNSIKSSDELRDDGFIVLPDRLSDGKMLSWKASMDKSFMYVLLLIPLLIITDYKSRSEKIRKKKESADDSIIKNLPRFNNSLILLLESGLIFEDAFFKIAKGYEQRNKKTFFEEFIIDVKHKSELTGKDYISILNEKAVTVKNRDLSRLGSVFADSRSKGISFVDKLSSESDYLWEERKKHTTEKSKKAEVQMTLPLGIMLISLIMITASPAILQI